MDFGDLFDERTFTFSDFQEFTVSIWGVFVLVALFWRLTETHGKLTKIGFNVFFHIKPRILECKKIIILKYSKYLLYLSM